MRHNAVSSQRRLIHFGLRSLRFKFTRKRPALLDQKHAQTIMWVLASILSSRGFPNTTTSETGEIKIIL